MDSQLPSALDEELARLRARIYRLEQALLRQGIALDQEWKAAPAVESQRAANAIAQAEAAMQPEAIQPPEAMAQAEPGMGQPRAGDKLSPRLPALADGRPEEARSLESRIGSQWLNRIGILAVLVGVAWFLKFAIDNAWIGPMTRVSIGLVAGIGLMGWSQRFAARGYAAFSYSLKAIGSGVLYLVLWAAFSLYHFVPIGIAFAAMAAITVLNGYLSWRQDAELLGFYALAGGFVTPALLASKTDHEAALFAYLLMLDVALLALATVKPWPRMTAGAFAGTAIVAGGWAFRYYTPADRSETFVFAAALGLLFAAAPLAMRPSQSGAAWLASVAVPIVNAGLGFAALALLLPRLTSDGMAVLALAFAALSALLMWIASSSARDAAAADGMVWFRAVHLWLAVAFVAAALELRLHGIWITLGWLAEGLVLLGAGFWRSHALARWLALMVLALAIAKVFLVDVGEKSVGFRIVAFLGLGLVLLGVSFLYQRNWLRLRR